MAPFWHKNRPIVVPRRSKNDPKVVHKCLSEGSRAQNGWNKLEQMLEQDHHQD